MALELGHRSNRSLEFFMSLRSLKSFAAAMITALLLAACGGDSAPAATNLGVTPGESSATVTWDMAPGVEYWLFYAPTSSAPADTSSMHSWIGIPGGGAPMKVSSPYVVSGLVNGTSYSFSVDGRIDGGPGGPGPTPVVTTPRPAGNSWTVATATGGADLLSVAFGTSTAANASTGAAAITSFVASSADSFIYTSQDGAKWTGVATPNPLNGATYASNLSLYLLAGNSGTVVTSPDAVTWTLQTSAATAASSQTLYAIASNNSSMNVAVGAGGKIIYSNSSDGSNWLPATYDGTANLKDLHAVTYSAYNVGLNTAGTWIAVGNAGAMVQSADGILWKDVSSGSGTSNNLRGVAYGTSSSTSAGVFVTVSDIGTVLNSANGTGWTLLPPLAGVTALNAVTYGTQFVTVGDGGKIFYSTDGAQWTPSASSNSQPLYAVVHGSVTFVAVGAAGTNLQSK